MVECLAFNQAAGLDRSLSDSAGQLLVDVSELVKHDARTGIQRVVRQILIHWLLCPPDHFEVKAVYASPHETGYRYASCFTARLLDRSTEGCVDDPVEVYPGDIFLGLDLHAELVCAQQAVLQRWRMWGVTIGFVVYDLLPVHQPDWFPQGTAEKHLRWLNAIAQFDRVVCISQTVAAEVNQWLTHNPRRKDHRAPRVSWFHLGADISPVASLDTQNRSMSVKPCLKDIPSFLMVGTLEPRKGHLQVLEAFEHLWSEGCEVNLVFAGKQGWMVDMLIKRIALHPQKISGYSGWIQLMMNHLSNYTGIAVA